MILDGHDQALFWWFSFSQNIDFASWHHFQNMIVIEKAHVFGHYHALVTIVALLFVSEISISPLLAKKIHLISLEVL